MTRYLKLDNSIKPIFLAPMAGYTDYAFRKVSFEMGLSFAVTEMVSAKALSYGDQRTKKIAKTEGRVGIQLFGHEPEAFKIALQEYLNKRNDFQWIDLNFGCPAPKIVKNGDGSYLLQEPEKIRKIIKAVKENTSLPVSAKMRLGFKGDENYIKIAQTIEEAGADFLTVHGRTRDMFYSGEANWDAIYEIRNHLSIPVIGNGDIKTAQEVDHLLQSGDIDGVAIGRAAIGNPFIFAELTGKEVSDKKEVIKRHFKYSVQDKGERVGLNDFKKHLLKYLNNKKDAKKIRLRLDKLTNLLEMEEAIESLF